MQAKCSKKADTLLETLYKNVSMAKESLLAILPKVKDKAFKDELTTELDRYERYKNELDELFRQSDCEEKMQALRTKMSARLDVGIKTITDDSEQSIAQMHIENTTEWSTDIIRELRECENGRCSEKAITLAKNIVAFQEKQIEKMKSFL